MSIHRHVGALGSLAVLLLAATACGGSDSDDAAAEGPTPVTVTTFGCEMWNEYALAEGIYADHGLEVEKVQSSGGSANVAAVLSGAADFGYVNGYSAMSAATTGFPIKIVTGAAVNALPPADPSQGLFVTTDSPIQSAQDLVGKKVAVNEINGINMIVTQSWLVANGVDPADVQFVALPFQDQVPAVLSGQVDAAQSGWTYVGDNAGAVRSVVDPFAESGEVLLGTYVASSEFVAEGDTAERFHAAVSEAIDELDNDPAAADRGFEAMAACQDLDVDVIKAQPQNGMNAAVSLDTLTTMAEQMVDLKLLKEVPAIEDFVPEFARS
jgi:ABC-type nitrate/sulfonate/bicarbonate transport system substrate-binding protein